MMFEGVLSWFRPAEAEVVQETSWDPVTLTMVQPKSPVAPTTDEIVTDQPVCLIHMVKKKNMLSRRTLIRLGDGRFSAKGWTCDSAVVTVLRTGKSPGAANPNPTDFAYSTYN